MVKGREGAEKDIQRSFGNFVGESENPADAAAEP